jgi:glycosyltransferase involved in cell wall biosynthesis
VTTFHDLQHKRHPEHFRWWDLPFWRFFLFWSAHLSRRVVAISNATASDLRRFYRLPERRLRVVPSGVDPVFFDVAARRRPERFLLSVSTLHPHKNLDGFLPAFAALRQSRPDFRLIVCGMHGFFAGPAHELRDRLGLAGAVDFPGWVPRDQLYDLFARAWAFVYPSKFEGFGLPVLEALAAGVPTACSNIEPLAGIAGDAALQFDPADIDAMTGTMRRLIEDEPLRVRLAEAGPKRAAEFGWRSTAEAMAGVFKEAAGS